MRTGKIFPYRVPIGKARSAAAPPSAFPAIMI
jgi:hypothetical protein